MSNLTIDQLIQSTSHLYLSTGDKVKKSFVIELMVDYGQANPSVGAKVWSILVKSGRIQKGVVMDVTDTFLADTVGIVRDVLLALQPDGGLTEPLVEALYRVTGLPIATIQAALNTLENEYFLEQRRAVAPWQYIPRKWAA